MATKYEGCSNYPKADIRASNMPSSHELAMYKFGLLWICLD